jgi:hypothetical protein
MTGNTTGADRRGVPESHCRATTAIRVLARVGAVVLVVVLGWIDPMLILLVGFVVGIGWLRRTDADPVHWGPVPRTEPGRARVDADRRPSADRPVPVGHADRSGSHR